jgi:single-strand DNA-binding protein
MLNKSLLIGRLTKDVEVKHLGFGDVCNFTLAVRRRYKNQEGKYDADFVLCSAYGDIAYEIANEYKKGELVSIEGEIRTRHYDKEDGTRIFITEVRVNQINHLENKEDPIKEEELSFEFESLGDELPF